MAINHYGKRQNIKNIFIKLFWGFIIYFAIINILISNQYGTLFTPREWLLNPLFNYLYSPIYLHGLYF